ncbi:tyrosine-type recombinase/integrase [Candidatus Babeliales bacterium]|nr:tyrosine-type recombinase/integrase [Candidatus Babeliales bacterium]MBP9844337.1 tyrosine-type recombinase/integrase [Candidatus Babeliales bacterium]
MQYHQALEKKEEFLVYVQVERNLTDNTYKSYSSDLHQFFTFWKEHNEQTKKDVAIKTALEFFFVQHFYKKTQKSSLARKISCFTSFERFLKSNGIVLNLQLTRPKVEKKLPTYLTVQEIFYLLDTVQDKDLPSHRPIRDKAIFEVLYATGIRCSELTQIRLEDINFQEKTILIKGKGRKQRYVLFGEKAKTKIIEYMNAERFINDRGNSILFVNAQGESLTNRTIQMILNMFGKFLTVKKQLTPHKVRHSFATHLLNAGLDLRALQELLGHQSLSSTEKYTHVTTKDLQNMYNTIHPINSMFPIIK